MKKNLTGKNIEIVDPRDAYKWAKNFKRIQDKFYDGKYKLRRLQQIEDFVKLNGFYRVYHIEEVLLDLDIPTVSDISDSDLILVTHQGYGRYPLTGIIKQIQKWLTHCDHLYFCLNRHYINIDNQRLNYSVPDDFQQAITYWLQKELPNCVVVDMSRNYIDTGRHFTWSCPDRHFYIRKVK